MYEVEVKVRAGHDAVRGALADLGATRLGAVVQDDTYYDAPHRSFAETDEALRVRRETPLGGESGDGDDAAGGADAASNGSEAQTGERALLTYKGPRVDAASKTRREHETTVGDPGTVDAALRALGFSPAATVRKERERYRLGEYAVVLDEVEGLGEFVEVDRDADEGAVEAVRAGAADLLADLGLDPDEGIRASYLELLAEG